jgi:hypothetical protein
MAMIECRECKKPVSDEAATCPSCGVKVRDTIFWPWVFLAVCLVLSAMMLYGHFMPESQKRANAAHEAYEVCSKMAAKAMDQAGMYACAKERDAILAGIKP